MLVIGLVAGAALALLGRALFPHLLLVKFRRDVAKLNAGDHSAVLGVYAKDMVLHFNEGPHRWSGEWKGREMMDRFLQMFIAARIQGRLLQITTSGPLWALTLWARFDDWADGPDGARLYENSTVLVLRTRWGKVVEQNDFYVDTRRIVEFDRRLTALEGAAEAAGPGAGRM